MEADFVIVGAGSAGCALAYRLSEAGASVLVVEHGGSDAGPFIQMPAALSYPMNMRMYDWGYRSEPEPRLNNRRLVVPRGKVIGGSSSINGMVYVRGHAMDYDHWQKSGATGWGFADVLPYFKRLESWHDGGHGGDAGWRGTDGPLHVSRGPRDNPLHAAFVEAGRQAGYELTDDYNGQKQEGFGPMDQTVWNGRRWSAANAYLRPALRRANCSLLRGLVERVVVEDGRAIGVALAGGQVIRARRSVVLAACGSDGDAGPEPVTQKDEWVLRWNGIAMDAAGIDHGGAREQLGPTRASRAMAMVHWALFEVANAFERDYQSALEPAPVPPAGASMKVALASTAHDMLAQLYPGQAAGLRNLLAADVAEEANSSSREAGIAFGTVVAQQVLAAREGDGSELATPEAEAEYPFSDQPGRWRVDPLNPDQQALGSLWSQVRPFALTQVDAFRAPPPPDLSSAEYAEALNEVARLGGDGLTTPTERTSDQTLTGLCNNGPELIAELTDATMLRGSGRSLSAPLEELHAEIRAQGQVSLAAVGPMTGPDAAAFAGLIAAAVPANVTIENGAGALRIEPLQRADVAGLAASGRADEQAWIVHAMADGRVAALRATPEAIETLAAEAPLALLVRAQPMSTAGLFQ